MIKEKSTTHKIEVMSDGQIQVQKKNEIVKDGVVISSIYHRHCIVPSADLTQEDAVVKKIANVVWTPAVIQAFKAKK